MAAVSAHKTEEFFVSGVTEQLYKEARLRSYVAKERAAGVQILREARSVSLGVAAARFVLDGGLRRHQERLFGKVDPDLRPLLIFRAARQTEETDSSFVTAKEHFEVATRTESLRPPLGLPRDDKSIVELAGFNEDFVSKHEVPQRNHQRRRRLFEHPDDDAIVGSNSSMQCS